MPNIEEMIRSPIQQVYRRAYIKRRSASTGLFETDWQDITQYVKSWGSYTQEIDYERLGTINIGGTNLVVSNVEGKFNPYTVDSSLWYGYGDQQRTLVKIEAGYVHQTLSSSGIWTNTEYPGTALFNGLVSGNIGSGTKGEVSLPIRPLTQVFQDYPATKLGDYNVDGVTGSQFITQVRDQTVSGSYLFRPFFGDTTTNWSITATTVNYAYLDSVGSASYGGRDYSVWEIIQKLAQADQFMPYVTKTGVFRWESKTVGASSVFIFNGVGSEIDLTYGTTIKDVRRYGKKLTNYYSRVVVRFGSADAAFAETSTGLTITGTNDPWNLGYRTFETENLWIDSSAVAGAIAGSLLTELSNNTEEIEFTATFVPHINVLDRITVNYDPTPFELTSTWDNNDWDTELTWHNNSGDAIVLNDAEFKVLSVEVDLDSLETKIVAKLI